MEEQDQSPKSPEKAPPKTEASIIKPTKPSIWQEFWKGCNKLFWQWYGLDNVAEDITTHGEAVRKGAALRFLLIIATLAGLAGFGLKSCVDESGNKQAQHDLEMSLHDNINLTTENSRLKSQIEPIQSEAQKLYPQLEIEVAVAKLVNDLNETRNLATRSDYKSLSDDLKTQVEDALKKVKADYPDINIAFSIDFQTGSLARQSICDELVNMFGVAHLSAENGNGHTIMNDENSQVRFIVGTKAVPGLAPPNINYINDVARAISPFLLVKPRLEGSPENPPTMFDIQILGNPSFMPNGSVTFN